jgi:type IV secretory pathway component VirB8
VARGENIEKINYSKIVGSIMEEGVYFKDARSWYYLKYVSILSERTFLILLSMISVVTVILLALTIGNILPLKESFPVLIVQHDSAKYYTTIKSMKPKKIGYSSNEAILRFLLIRYVRELFTHQYKTGKIEDINNKLIRVKNYSTDEILQRFKNDLNQIITGMFNKNVEQKIYIKTFKFIDKDDINSGRFGVNFIKKLITNRKIPAEAELEYEILFLTPKEKITRKQKISLDFKFDAIKYNSVSGKFDKPTMIVTNYTIINMDK